MSRHRARFESVASILRTIKEGETLQSDILRKSNVSYSLGSKIFVMLLNTDHLGTVQAKHERTEGIELSYVLTNKGRELLDELEAMIDKYMWLLEF